MIRFVHCADIHLGRSIRTHGDVPEHLGEAIKEATYLSFQRIVDKAIEEEVDFVLISGDVYDQEQRSLKGQWFVKKQAERLLAKEIPLFIIHGNHDPLNMEVGEQSMPRNVHIFPHEVKVVPLTTKRKETVYIYGFSYPEKAYTENPIPMFERNGNPNGYHIAMLHGQENTQKEHEPYAPFTLKELQEKYFDYWALGHIHIRKTLSSRPLIVYPGNIQGAHRKETGEKGAYLVEMSKGETKLTFFATNPVQWEKVTVSIEGVESFDQLLERLEEDLSFTTLSKKYLFDLTIDGSGTLHDRLMDPTKQEELLTLLRENLLNANVHWVDRIHYHTLPEVNRSQLREQDHLLGDVVRTVDELKANLSMETPLQQVYGHTSLKKYLTPLSEKDMEEILNDAEIRLLTPLLRELER